MDSMPQRDQTNTSLAARLIVVNLIAAGVCGRRLKPKRRAF